jgi:hypothetical protein
MLVEHLRDLVGDLVSNLLCDLLFDVLFDLPADLPAERLLLFRGIVRPHVESLHSHFPHLKPGPGVGPWVRVRSAAYRQHTHAKTHADATAEKSDEKENTDYDQTDDQLVGGRGRTRRWADRSATVRA